MSTITVDAPTKINLRLKVVGKRADGYHFLSMLNEKLALVDRITISTNGEPQKYIKDFPVELRCEKVPSLETASNLVVKAAWVMAERYNVSTPLNISIEKNIPIGAGLGGGSSDAAACLMALNELWGLHKPPEELAKVGVTIGADVPFFMWPGPAHVTGIGEFVNRDVHLPKLWLLLVNPGFEVSTKWVYNQLGFELTPNIEDDSFPTHFNDLGELASVVENDLEKVVVKKYSEVEEIKDLLRSKGASIVFMSGSGPTVVGIFHSEDDRDKALSCSRPSGWSFFATENQGTGGR